MGLLGRRTHVGDDESYTAVGESSKYDLEAQLIKEAVQAIIIWVKLLKSST